LIVLPPDEPACLGIPPWRPTGAFSGPFNDFSHMGLFSTFGIFPKVRYWGSQKAFRERGITLKIQKRLLSPPPLSLHSWEPRHMLKLPATKISPHRSIKLPPPRLLQAKALALRWL
jgi:hypothetical protein